MRKGASTVELSHECLNVPLNQYLLHPPPVVVDSCQNIQQKRLDEPTVVLAGQNMMKSNENEHTI